MPRSAKDCFKVLQDSLPVGVKLSDELAKEILERIENQAKELIDEGGFTAEQAIRKAEKIINGQRERWRLVNRRAALMQIETQNRQVDKNILFTEPQVDTKTGKTFPGAVVGEGMIASSEGISKGIFGAADSIDARHQEAKRQAEGEFLIAIGDSVGDFMSGKIEKEIIIELSNLGKTRPDGSPISGNAKAVKIAEEFTKTRSKLNANLNRHGAWLEERAVYAAHHDHDPKRLREQPAVREALARGEETNKVQEISFQSWRSIIINDIDHNGTFGGANSEKALRNMHENIWLGIHGRENKNGAPQAAYDSPINGPYTNVPAFGGTAKKASQRLFLKFKNESLWWKYNAKMGKFKKLKDTFFHEIDVKTKSATLMGTYGPNAELGFNNILKQTEQWVINNDAPDFPKQKNLDSINLNKAGVGVAIKASFYKFTGFDRIQNHGAITTAMDAAKTFEITSKLENVAIISLGDKPLLFTGLARIGVKKLDALWASLRVSFPNKKFLQSQGHGLESWHGHVVKRFVGEFGKTTGALASTRKWFMNLNFMNILNDAHKLSSVDMLARELALNSGKAFDQLNPTLQVELKRSGISAPEWEVVRKSRGTSPNGTEYVIQSEFEKGVTDADIDKFLRSKGVAVNKLSRSNTREELRWRLATFLSDQTDSNILTPGLKESRIATFNTPTGSTASNSLQLVTMFKSFMISFMTKIMGRALRDPAAARVTGFFPQALFTVRNHPFALFGMMGMMTAAAYISKNIRNLLIGREPIKLWSEENGEFKLNEEALVNAFATSGGLGFFSEALFAEYDRGFNAFTQVLAGPFIGGTVNDLAALSTDAIKGIVPGGEAFNPRPTGRFIQNALPFVNLFYVRPVLEWAFWNSFNEMLDPAINLGRAESLERRGSGFADKDSLIQRANPFTAFGNISTSPQERLHTFE